MKVPTSPGWGPVFGGRPAAAAVLAAAPGVDLDFASLFVLRCVGASFVREGGLGIQARALGKSFFSLTQLSEDN